MLGLRLFTSDFLSSTLKTWPKVFQVSVATPRPISTTAAQYATGSTGTTSDPVPIAPKYANVPDLQSADDIVKKVFSLEFASQSAHHKAARAQIIEQYQMRPGDTGSTPVQIAALTSRIQRLTEHMKQNRKDKCTLRTLIILVHRRRKLLRYLKRKDFQKFHEILKELNLREPKTDKYAIFKMKRR